VSYWAGIDCGSWATKAVVIDQSAQLLGTGVARSGADLAAAAERAYTLALAQAGRDRGEMAAVWATGFGRQSVGFADGSRTELDCHGRGAAYYVREPVVVIDIGGQDAKVIRLDADGRRLAHRMNRKCAAGTGSFLDEIALRLGIEVSDLDHLAAAATENFELSSFCTVFAGTELLTLIRAGKRPADLARRRTCRWSNESPPWTCFRDAWWPPGAWWPTIRRWSGCWGRSFGRRSWCRRTRRKWGRSARHSRPGRASLRWAR